MALSYKTSLRNTMLDAITSAIGTSGLLRIYDGTPPADANTALSGNTQLASMACSATFAPGASGGVLVANSIAADTSTVAGTATFFRFLTSGGTCIIQGTVGTSGADLNLPTVTFTNGGTVTVGAFSLAEGNP